MEADAKARFLRAVLEGSIDLRRATDEAIVATMKSHTLPPLSGMKDVESVDSYEYLLRLRMDRVKASAIAEAEDHVAKASAAVAALEKTTAATMWLSDLDEFEKAWTSMRDHTEALLTNGGTATVVKKKVRVAMKA